ncbi:MAG: hypothetical protein K0B11_17485 [Mariniphaga sp.]|nr:hypothetical protein [Mariniphaga sp.]
MKTEKRNKNGKNRLTRIMRSLHRDIGFILIGLTIIYSLSGILLIYRDTGFLKKEREITQTIAPNLEAEELASILHMRNFKVVRTDGNMLFFNNGQYNRENGLVEYTSRELPAWLNKMNSLHKTSTRSPLHWLGIIYGILLFFMAISSLWMFKSGTGLFRRGIILTASGAAVVLVIIFV